MSEQLSRCKNFVIFLLVGIITNNTIFIVNNNLIIINANTNNGDYVYYILICLAASILYLSALNILYYRLAFRLINNQYKDIMQIYLKYKSNYFIASFILSYFLTYTLYFIVDNNNIYHFTNINSYIFLSTLIYTTIALNCALVTKMDTLKDLIILSGILTISDLNMHIEDIQVTTVYNSI